MYHVLDSPSLEKISGSAFQAVFPAAAEVLLAQHIIWPFEVVFHIFMTECLMPGRNRNIIFLAVSTVLDFHRGALSHLVQFTF
jgi:hypothetical protein